MSADGSPAGTPVQVQPGALLQYYSDLSSGMLPPENMRIDDLTFTVQIDPLGNIVFETPKVTLQARYNFGFRRVQGWVMDPDVAGAAAALVSFNVQEQGRDFNVFKTPVRMSSVLSRGGAGISEWDGVYITIPGTDMAVSWFVDTKRWAALVGASKEFGVQLLGDYVICRGNF